MIKILIGIGLIALFVVIRYFHKRNYYICRNARKEQIEKVHREFERKEVKQILTDIRDYLVKKQGFYKPQLCHMDRLMFFIYAEQLNDLTEYAEKLGVKL